MRRNYMKSIDIELKQAIKEAVKKAAEIYSINII